jgi:dTMP kinase
MTGIFITLEGGDGVGKTSHLGVVRKYFEAKGTKVTVTREPGGTPLGESVRSWLLGHGQLSSMSELLLVFAARAQHLEEVILPALELGHVVVCDRYVDASFAYQGGGRGLSIDFISELERQLPGQRPPDLTLLLDAPVELAAKRAKGRGHLDRFEAEERSFFERVRKAYLQRAEQFPERIRLIDASQPLEAVAETVLATMRDAWG